MKRLATSIAVLALYAGAAAPALATPSTPSWVATWGIPINSSKTTAFTNRTIRVLAQTSLGGSQVRVRLSNDNGTGRSRSRTRRSPSRGRARRSAAPACR